MLRFGSELQPLTSASGVFSGCLRKLQRATMMTASPASTARTDREDTA